MFVSSLDIREFRGIKETKETIHFSNFNVLIGRNNSGKSTILESLSLLPSPKLDTPIIKSSREKYLYKLHPSKESRNKRLLYQYAGESSLTYHIQSQEILIKLNNSGWMYKKNGKDVNLNSFFSNLYPKMELSNLCVFIPDSSLVLEDLENQMEYNKEILTKRGSHIELAKFLNRCVNDEYSELVFLEPISLRKVYENKSVYIQVRDLGAGAEKVIKIMAFLEIIDPKLVLIDDFEAGLHPTLIKIFLEWLKQKKYQTIISTHSIDVLYHLIDINPEDTSILQLNKSNDDVLSYNSLTLNQIEDILDANNDPRWLGSQLNL